MNVVLIEVVILNVVLIEVVVLSVVLIEVVILSEAKNPRICLCLCFGLCRGHLFKTRRAHTLDKSPLRSTDEIA